MPPNTFFNIHTTMHSFFLQWLLCFFLLTGYARVGAVEYHQPASTPLKGLTPPPHLSKERFVIVQAALKLANSGRWLHYHFGSANPAKGGLDCSGSIYYLLQSLGLRPPRTSADQYLWLAKAGCIHQVNPLARTLKDASFEHLAPGDLIFWTGTYQPTDGRKVPISHVGIYLGKEGDGRHIMACASRGRSYRGVRQEGFGIYDLKLPSASSKARCVAYGSPAFFLKKQGQ